MTRAPMHALATAILLTGSAAGGETEDALASILEKDVKEHLEFLTSDDCAGREAGQSGLKRACDYAAERMGAAGLEPLGTDGSFLRAYELPCEDVHGESSLVVATSEQDARECVLRDEFMPLLRTAQGVAEGDLVFAGYGIRERKYRWDDYDQVDVRGKVVLVLAREPRADHDDRRFFEGMEMTESSSLREKAALAADRGAVGLLVVPASEEEAPLWLYSQYPVHPTRRGAQDLALPAAVLAPQVARELLGQDPAALRDEMDRRKRSQVFACAARAHLEVKLQADASVTQHNVVARYPGSDPARSGEVVVIGAHIDHDGVDDRGRVYRGADDNAGGVAALLEVADAFGRHRPRVARSIVFVAFSGEERGLLGSAAYVRDPPVPMSATYAMINLDIIARGRPRAIEATVPDDKIMLNKLLKPALRLAQCRLDVGDGGKEFFQRSDHYEFHKAGVPTVFFNEGKLHEDYHRWTDTPDKALTDKIERVARLAFALACLAADSDLPGGLR